MPYATVDDALFNREENDDSRLSLDARRLVTRARFSEIALLPFKNGRSAAPTDEPRRKQFESAG
jgi:hypothetical protein